MGSSLQKGYSHGIGHRLASLSAMNGRRSLGGYPAGLVSCLLHFRHVRAQYSINIRTMTSAHLAGYNIWPHGQNVGTLEFFPPRFKDLPLRIGGLFCSRQCECTLTVLFCSIEAFPAIEFCFFFLFLVPFSFFSPSARRWMGQCGSIPMVSFLLPFQKIGGFLLGVVISLPQASDTDGYLKLLH